MGFQATFIANRSNSKPVLRCEFNNGGRTLQGIERKILTRMGAQPIHQHHLSQTGLQARASTLMGL